MILFPDVRCLLTARQFKDFRKILRSITSYKRLQQVSSSSSALWCSPWAVA